MKLNIYAIFDNAAKAYMSPFFMHNHGLATRAFSDQVNAQQENQISLHPEQFALFHIGEYNDETGHIEPLATPDPLGRGNQFKSQNENIDKLEELLDKFETLVKESKKS